MTENKKNPRQRLGLMMMVIGVVAMVFYSIFALVFIPKLLWILLILTGTGTLAGLFLYLSGKTEREPSPPIEDEPVR